MLEWESIRAFLDAVISIFAIVNPIGNLPVFVSLTADVSDQSRRRLFRVAGIVGLVIVLVMAIAGKFILRYVFHISIDEFMFGGGLMLVVVGIRNLLQSREVAPPKGPAASEQERFYQYLRVAVSPIAVPLLVGPGTIVTAMLIVDRDGARGFTVGMVAILAAFFLVGLVLRYSHLIFKAMGDIGALAVGRIMQIFIVAIGVRFLFQALKGIFPMLK